MLFYVLKLTLIWFLALLLFQRQVHTNNINNGIERFEISSIFLRFLNPTAHLFTCAVTVISLTITYGGVPQELLIT